MHPSNTLSSQTNSHSSALSPITLPSPNSHSSHHLSSLPPTYSPLTTLPSLPSLSSHHSPLPQLSLLPTFTLLSSPSLSPLSAMAQVAGDVPPGPFLRRRPQSNRRHGGSPPVKFPVKSPVKFPVKFSASPSQIPTYTRFPPISHLLSTIIIHIAYRSPSPSPLPPPSPLLHTLSPIIGRSIFHCITQPRLAPPKSIQDH